MNFNFIPFIKSSKPHQILASKRKANREAAALADATRPPILIYTMGKVGSSTIRSSLHAVSLPKPGRLSLHCVDIVVKKEEVRKHPLLAYMYVSIPVINRKFQTLSWLMTLTSGGCQKVPTTEIGLGLSMLTTKLSAFRFHIIFCGVKCNYHEKQH